MLWLSDIALEQIRHFGTCQDLVLPQRQPEEEHGSDQCSRGRRDPNELAKQLKLYRTCSSNHRKPQDGG